MKLRKKRGKVKGFEVKKGKINYTPDFMIEKKKQDEFERAYKVDTNALYNSGVVKVIKRRGEEYKPRNMEHLKKPLSDKAKLRKKRGQERRKIEITERRERLKQDKKAGTGVYAKKTTKKSKIKGGDSTPLKMLKPKTNLEVSSRKKKLEAKELTRPQSRKLMKREELKRLKEKYRGTEKKYQNKLKKGY
tara:strand:+ start:252 stop:821 length:570 start_codon:yes stop_codon:yes gene_type:complete